MSTLSLRFIFAFVTYKHAKSSPICLFLTFPQPHTLGWKIVIWNSGLCTWCVGLRQAIEIRPLHFVSGIGSRGCYSWYFSYCLVSYSLLICDQDLEDHEMTFIFLTDHQVLLAGGDRSFLGVLDLRTLNGQSADSMEEIDYVCRLLLPEPDHSEESDEIRTDVFCELKSNFGYSRSPYADITGNLSPARVVPIHADPSQRIIILEFHIIESVGERRSSLVIPSSTILSCFDLQSLTSNRTLEWKLWGPQGTRYFRCIDENDADNVYGSRWMTCYRPGDGTATISIFDFNQRVVRRRLPFTESDGDVARKLKSGEWVLVTLPNTIRPDADSPFAESVTTALPFLLREIHLPEPMNHFHQRPHSISLTEDAIFFTVDKRGLENVEDVSHSTLLWDVLADGKR